MPRGTQTGVLRRFPSTLDVEAHHGYKNEMNWLVTTGNTVVLGEAASQAEAERKYGAIGSNVERVKTTLWRVDMVGPKGETGHFYEDSVTKAFALMMAKRRPGLPPGSNFSATQIAFPDKGFVRLE